MRHRGFICCECALLLSSPRLQPVRACPGLKRRRQASTAATSRPLRVGIIGSGPAGFYAALRILQRMEDAKVDMYEQLPAPFGLVRYGVAPDHPEVKNCQDRFEEVAQSARFKFIGNVEIGREVSLGALSSYYDALLLAYGAGQDKELGLPGEHLKGVLSARAFVGWYNGLPEYDSLSPDLTSGENAIVIGNGNVALDIARILLSGVDALRKTDITEKALDVLSMSKVKHVMVCGRRGPMQAAFTIKEVRELLNLPGVGFEPVDGHLLPTADWISVLPRLEQRKYRLANLLAKGSKTPWEGSERSWSLMSLLSPQRFEPAMDSNCIKGVSMTRNVYDSDDERFEHDARTVPTDQSEFVEANLAFRSIGYKSLALNGLEAELNVAFDEKKGIVPNDGQGRAFAASRDSSSSDNLYVAGCYCAGWVKRGPTGVIASTMEDAFASADALMKDWMNGMRFLNGSTREHPLGSGLGWEGVLEDSGVQRNRDLRPISWQDWRRIDAAEVGRGKEKGKPREKFRSQDEMLAVLD